MTGAILVPPEGKTNSKITLVGEAPSYDEIRLGRPFVGQAGEKLNECLHGANIIRQHCYITNLIKCMVPHGDIGRYYNGNRGVLTSEGQVWANKLYEELSEVTSNVIVCLGGPATAAITGFGKLLGRQPRRGYVFPAVTQLNKRKCIPTMHPAAVLYPSKGAASPYFGMYYIMHDLKRAVRECEFPQILYPRRDIHVASSFDEACSFLQGPIKVMNPVAFDIEHIEFQVSMIGFAGETTRAYVIPIHKAYTDLEEVIIWDLIAKVVGNEHTTKILQNAISDMSVLWQKNNIQVRGKIIDTMIGHSIVYPDFYKSLGFLASIYTDSYYWKDMANFHSIKDEE